MTDGKRELFLPLPLPDGGKFVVRRRDVDLTARLSGRTFTAQHDLMRDLGVEIQT